MSTAETGPTTVIRPKWEDWIARTTAVLAVFAALSSGQWGASNLRAILEQGRVDDGWSYYQAKSIKNHLAEHMQGLAGAMAADQPAATGQAGALRKYQMEMEAEAKRLAVEKATIEKDVHGYEAARDGFVERSFWFELAFACIQAGVVLSTIAAAAKKKSLWLTALCAGVLGALLLVNGLTHVVKTPEYAHKLAPKLGMKDPLAQPK